MSDDALYQDRIIGLARSRTGAGLLDDPDARVTIDNPLCGDRVTLDLTLDGAVVERVGHKVRGCLLCEAAAALIAAEAPGAGPDRLRRAAASAEAQLQPAEPPGPEWPDLAAFRPVAAAKSRHRCVLLPFEALLAALEKTGL